MIYSNRYYWFKAFDGGDLRTNYYFHAYFDLTILSKITKWSIFLEKVQFKLSSDYDGNDWIDCIIPYLNEYNIVNIKDELKFL
jgi:hypothetical protein